MSPPTIDRTEAIEHFRELMQPDSAMRVMRLVGNSKTGKSHLLTKVFPVLAERDFNVRYAIVDLRNPMMGIPDMLHMICFALGGEPCFPAYTTAYQEWMHRPHVEVRSLRTILSFIRIHSSDEGREHHKVIRHLTAQFTKDLSTLATETLVLLFDTAEGADNTICSWLVDTLLVQIARLPHMRVVIAGRSVPEANGSYASVCWSYELVPVEEPEEYVSYCLKVGADLPEQSIRDIALVLDHLPGLFVELVVPKFGKRLKAYG